jgi:hypothetical protein
MEMVSQNLDPVYGNGQIKTLAIYGNGIRLYIRL